MYANGKRSVYIINVIIVLQAEYLLYTIITKRTVNTAYQRKNEQTKSTCQLLTVARSAQSNVETSNDV